MNPNLIPTLVLTGHWLIVIGLSVRVIMRRAPVGISLAWLTVVFSVPLGGAALYLLFGEKRLGRRRRLSLGRNIPRRNRWLERERGRSDVNSGPGAGEMLIRQAEKVSGFPAQSGNTLVLLAGSEAFFDRLIADIDASQKRVHLAFYIWHPGGRVDELADALIRATARGVQCRALADAVGSKDFRKSKTFNRLRLAGVDMVDTLPTGLVRMLFVRADLRNHRKIAVIDQAIAYAGSQNLVDPRLFRRDTGVGEWIDAMVRISGPAALMLDSVFELDWAVETGTDFFDPGDCVTSDSRPEAGSLVQITPSGPDVHQEAIHWSLLAAVYAARREIILSTPYFVPDDSILTALLSAATRGVEVTIIVPARNDSLFVRYASVANFDQLMDVGVNLALFEGGLLHTKSLTVDGEVSVFGSVNLDMRSFWLNFEISLIVADSDFSARLRALQLSYLAASTRLDPEGWRRRAAHQVFLSNMFRLLGPLI